ncbi:MAG: hypothetical protein DHS20C21_08790 [Gemmatimonadota bacterium]|nr:MAG: hypothetical protein DHS20C21_08790 [Gemmatimonadota bacterium]
MRRLIPRLITAAVPLLFVSIVSAQTVSTLTAAFSASGDISVDAAGNIYVADYGDLLSNANGTTVYKVTPAGAVSVFATGLSGASGNEFGPDGTLYQSNIASGVISKIDPAGTVTTFSTGHAGPVGIALDPAGNVYVTNCGDNSIRKVTPAGVMSTLVTGAPLSCPNGLTYADDGNLYTCNFNDGKVLRITLAGVVSEFGSTNGNNAGHLTYRDGALWVVARGGNRIYRFDLDGNRVKVAGLAFRGNTDGDKSVATFSLPNGIGMSPDGTKLYTNSVQAVAGQALNPILLREIDISEVTAAPDLGVADRGLSVRVFPNPARPNSQIQYELARSGNVSVRIFDVRGREVRALWNGVQSAGQRSVAWDGTDQQGKPLAAGVYLYTLRVGERTTTDRVLLLR